MIIKLPGYADLVPQTQYTAINIHKYDNRLKLGYLITNIIVQLQIMNFKDLHILK